MTLKRHPDDDNDNDDDDDDDDAYASKYVGV